MSYSRPPPNADGMISPKVDNLTYRTSPNTLRRVFEKSGRVGDVYIPWDRFTEEPRGFAVVCFHDKRHAEDAMGALDGIVLDGHPEPQPEASSPLSFQQQEPILISASISLQPCEVSILL
ncbi:hypothetical protein J1605_022647 [Eschrichtius robustus]|uniref:Serine/arginine-rich splicing factor 2 n=1 Tax=Eschrichtius robustus TaxID=9764 RepID=A0AB34H8M5_ESCRO|nr:hypothetical protein J1605_022647 [Eschrichtius robustus]